tara:strand:+ start:1287 stop:1556 length:270 start_codon:yes stop_codon:yes gene_type:complete
MSLKTTPLFFTNHGEFTAALDAGTAPSGSILVSENDQRIESVFIGTRPPSFNGTHGTHWCAHRRHNESLAEFLGKVVELSGRFNEVTNS